MEEKKEDSLKYKILENYGKTPQERVSNLIKETEEYASSGDVYLTLKNIELIKEVAQENAIPIDIAYLSQLELSAYKNGMSRMLTLAEECAKYGDINFVNRFISDYGKYSAKAGEKSKEEKVKDIENEALINYGHRLLGQALQFSHKGEVELTKNCLDEYREIIKKLEKRDVDKELIDELIDNAYLETIQPRISQKP